MMVTVIIFFIPDALFISGTGKRAHKQRVNGPDIQQYSLSTSSREYLSGVREITDSDL